MYNTQTLPTLLLCLFAASCQVSNPKAQKTMDTTLLHDKETLQKLNAQFIQNYINQDVQAHNELIHRDFVCIENSGQVISREVYLKNWATDYQNSGVLSFTYTDEDIRIFGDMALLRAKSVFTILKDGREVTGYSVYTDTYIKENGRWWCVQAHMTPVR